MRFVPSQPYYPCAWPYPRFRSDATQIQDALASLIAEMVDEAIRQRQPVLIERPGVESSQQPLLLKVPQAAELLNVSERHVRSMVSSGELPVVRMSVAIRISRRAVEQYIADQEQQEQLYIRVCSGIAESTYILIGPWRYAGGQSSKGVLAMPNEPQTPIVTPLLSVRDAAVRSNLTTSTLYRLIASGEVPAIRFSPRIVRIDSRVLEQWLAQQVGLDR